jgi:hypothetical protein
VAAVRIESPLLFEAIDPHGHAIDRNQFVCTSCRTATVEQGYCDACRMGCADGLTYFTRLTHGVARGMMIISADLSCPTCISHFNSTGWCESCRRGIVGNVVLRDRALYEVTAREYCTLQTAIKTSDSCDWCPSAMMLHSICPTCRISFELTSTSPST